MKKVTTWIKEHKKLIGGGLIAAGTIAVAYGSYKLGLEYGTDRGRRLLATRVLVDSGIWKVDNLKAAGKHDYEWMFNWLKDTATTGVTDELKEIIESCGGDMANTTIIAVTGRHNTH